MRGEDEIKSRVVGVDISISDTTYAIVDIRGNIIAEDSFRRQTILMSAISSQN